MTALVPWLLARDTWLQGLGALASLVGVVASVWLAREAWLDARAVRANGAVERLVTRSHLRSQLVILTVQLCFGLVSLLVLGLPPVPLDMGAGHGLYVVVVIAVRKVTRVSMILLLMGAAWRQAADRRHALQLLAMRRPR